MLRHRENWRCRRAGPVAGLVLVLALGLCATEARAVGLGAQLLGYRSEVQYLLGQHMKLVALVAFFSVGLGVPHKR